ncbi:LOW QUALITY PROTEIN: uncharacterized protein LOC133844958 [Drosophila sulfurigaster albostrigata]|uniref:LOW QUALITY PROTEIN: uncharacterized protein LOC133844958 n=1 Tax=Drosophila sulfurigaster albostrigata TaxID=89887 RepID=UPI002D21E186|nr:LOW QUALITY PROTEIN: uncharacterized protein LOC133844958 [Drosophila sulfurigaster albostrigata]
MELARKIILWIIPLFVLAFLLTMSEAYLSRVRVEETPFQRIPPRAASLLVRKQGNPKRSSGIHLISSLEHQRTFLHIFHVPYIICFYAAKGKWPYVPGFMKTRVNSAARNFFHQNDSFIKQFCTKWIQVKECFRPLFDKSNDTTVEVETLDAQKQIQRCDCDKLVSTEAPVPVVYFDKNYIGNVSSDTILSTIEFLESFLPPPTKKHKRKNRVRGRLDEIDID